MQRRLLIIFLVLIFAGGVFFVFTEALPEPDRGDVFSHYPKSTIVLGGGEILSLWIADTKERREQGLSNTHSLPEGAGLLFVFPESGIHFFWMKDMRYPIDIVWIDENNSIVHIEENVLPESYPETFSSQVFAKYVLEIPAFSARRYGFAEGLSVEI